MHIQLQDASCCLPLDKELICNPLVSKTGIKRQEGTVGGQWQRGVQAGLCRKVET